MGAMLWILQAHKHNSKTATTSNSNHCYEWAVGLESGILTSIIHTHEVVQVQVQNCLLARGTSMKATKGMRMTRFAKCRILLYH